MYGHPPRQFGLVLADAVHSSDLAEWLADRELMIQVVKQNLLRA
jgi:hypothetical protein